MKRRENTTQRPVLSSVRWPGERAPAAALDFTLARASVRDDNHCADASGGRTGFAACNTAC
jgi:hypothetical protein